MNSREQSFSIHLIFFWIRGLISIDTRAIRVNTRNTILFGLIPAGKNQQLIPVSNVSSAGLSTKYRVIPMLIGAFFILGSVGSFQSDFLAGIFGLIIGLLIFGTGIKTVLVIQRAGSDFYLEVPFYEKPKMMDAKDAIEEAIFYVENQRQNS